MRDGNTGGAVDPTLFGANEFARVAADLFRGTETDPFTRKTEDSNRLSQMTVCGYPVAIHLKLH